VNRPPTVFDGLVDANVAIKSIVAAEPIVSALQAAEDTDPGFRQGVAFYTGMAKESGHIVKPAFNKVEHLLQG
jgi:hypothetical protein